MEGFKSFEQQPNQEPEIPAAKPQEGSFDWSKIHEKNECSRCGNEFASAGSCQECTKNPEKIAYLKEQEKENPAPPPGSKNRMSPEDMPQKGEKGYLEPGYKRIADRPGFLRDKKGNIYDESYNLVEEAPSEDLQKIIEKLQKNRPDLQGEHLHDVARITLRFQNADRKARELRDARAKEAKQTTQKTVQKKKKK
jgi:hypothetical protein